MRIFNFNEFYYYKVASLAEAKTSLDRRENARAQKDCADFGLVWLLEGYLQVAMGEGEGEGEGEGFSGGEGEGEHIFAENPRERG
jgi:hypothetical protein